MQLSYSLLRSKWQILPLFSLVGLSLPFFSERTTWALMLTDLVWSVIGIPPYFDMFEATVPKCKMLKWSGLLWLCRYLDVHCLQSFPTSSQVSLLIAPFQYHLKVMDFMVLTVTGIVWVANNMQMSGKAWRFLLRDPPSPPTNPDSMWPCSLSLVANTRCSWWAYIMIYV